MGTKLVRVGTIYLPVQHLGRAAEWYETKLGAVINYQDEDKAILDMADLSLFLVKAKENQTSNFIDDKGNERFSITFEVDGEEELASLRKELMEEGVQVRKVEDRGHPGRNFVFQDLDGNCFDVWSKLSPSFKEKNH